MKRLILLCLLLMVVTPCLAQEPATVKEPAAPSKPATMEQPATVKEAEPVKPAAADEPSPVKQPDPTKPPATEETSAPEPAEPAEVDEPQPSVSEPAAVEDPAIAQDPAAIRFKEFVSAVSKSRRLVEIKSFFSQRMWKGAFLQASVTENAERQRSIVKDMARSYAKYTITDAKAIGPAVELTVITKDPEGQPVTQKIRMVQESEAWVIDG